MRSPAPLQSLQRVPTRVVAPLQGAALVLLRTLVGWHFLYEGYYKLMVPGWSREGQLLAHWSAAGYLKAASGPLAGLFHGLAASAAAGWIDRLVPIGLAAVGLSLILGFLTQIGCWGALGFLALFYVSSIPTAGVPQPGAEGTYLIVNKNLVEAAAVLVLTAFRTGTIAGLDVLRAAAMPRLEQPAETKTPISAVAAAASRKA
jgi:thiosulfate dehydrogenase (quinone) large subunit